MNRCSYQFLLNLLIHIFGFTLFIVIYFNSTQIQSNTFLLCLRDIKPENFLLGLKSGPNFNMIHMVDFGLAVTYLDVQGTG